MGEPGKEGESVDLDAIRARCEAATEGPWHFVNGGRRYGFGGVAPARGFTLINEIGEYDAEFIAHARTDIPALIAEVERLRSRA